MSLVTTVMSTIVTAKRVLKQLINRMEDENDETTEEDDTDDDDDNDEIRTETTNGTATTHTTRTVLTGVATMVAAKCCTGLATMVCATFFPRKLPVHPDFGQGRM